MTQILAPQLSCYITPPNQPTVDYGNYLVYSGGRGSINVTQNFGRQGDTATLNLMDANYSSGNPPNLIVHPTYIMPAFSTVKIIDQSALAYYGSDDAATIFAGYIQNPSMYFNSPTEIEWALSCVDYAGYMNASIVQGLFEGIPMGNAIVDLVKKSKCGIKAELVSNGGFVEKGPNLPRTIVHYGNLTSALQKISKMSSAQSAYGWYVDSQLNLHYFNRQTATDSGVTVTDSPTQSGLLSYTECHIDQTKGVQYDYDGTAVYNRALVVGKTQTISANVKKAPTNSFTADGNTSSWNLTHVPISLSGVQSATSKHPLPWLTVNGIGQTVSVYDGTSAVTTPWTIKQNNNGSWSLVVTPGIGSIPNAGTALKLWYNFKRTITAQADLKQSQQSIGGPNNGIFATVVNQTSIDTTASAYQRATRELAEYGHAQEKITFTTSPEWIGIWRAGDTFILDSQFLLDSQRNFAPGLNAKFMITQQSVSVINGGFRQWQVSAVRVE